MHQDHYIKLKYRQNTHENTNCWPCGEKYETGNHAITDYNRLTWDEYRNRHNRFRIMHITWVRLWQWY